MRLTDTTNPNSIHRAKRKLARKMRSEAERKRGVELFKSLRWRFRKGDIADRVAAREATAKAHAQQRKLERQNNGQ